MRPAGRRFLLLLLLSLAGCPKRVIVNGQELPSARADELAQVELVEVRRQARALPPAAGAERLLAFAARYRGVPTAADALDEAAALQLEARRPKDAARTLESLVAEYPASPRADAARLAAARLEVDQGRPGDALRNVAAAYPRLEPARRQEAALLAARAAQATGAAADQVRWQGEVAAQATGDARKDALARVDDAVERLAPEDVERLRAALPPDAPAQEALTMRAARLAAQRGDAPGAEALAREVFLRWPDGAHAAEARRMVERAGKLAFVRPDVIGVAVPLTGNYQPWGQAILKAVQLALGNPPAARLAVRDTRGDPEEAAKALEALALQDGAIAVVGGVTNAEAERSARAAEELGLPFVSLSKEAGVTAAGAHVFQNMLTAPAQARALVDLAMGRLGLRRFAVMYPSIPYGTELANAFWDEVEARGGEIRGAETYAPDRTTFTPLVKDLVGKLHLEERSDWVKTQRDILQTEKDPYRRKKALEKARDQLAPVTDFDAVFLPDFARNVKLITPALAVEDVVTQTCLPEDVARIAKVTGRPDLKAVQLLGANGWGTDPSLFDLSPGGAGRYVRCAIYVDGFFAGSARPATRAFVEAFEAANAGQVPTILEASAYDAAGMIRAQLARQVQTREAMREGLAAVKGYPGATGDITMGPDRTPQKALFYLTVDPKAGLRELGPEELSGLRPAGQP